MSESPLVYKAIAGVAADMAAQGIGKTRTNEQQGYRFRGIDEVMNALAPSMVKHGLLILPRVLTRTVTERPSRGGGLLFYVVVESEFDFVAVADGSKHTVKTYGEAMDSGDKATNKAESCAYKYAAFQAFCIPTEGEAEDADATTHEVAPAPRPPRQKIADEVGEVFDAAAPPPEPDGAEPKCPVCGGPMWDNRADRRQDEADIAAGKRTKKARAAWRCKERECKGTVWPCDPNERPKSRPKTDAAPDPLAEARAEYKRLVVKVQAAAAKAKIEPPSAAVLAENAQHYIEKHGPAKDDAHKAALANDCLRHQLADLEAMGQ